MKRRGRGYYTRQSRSSIGDILGLLLVSGIFIAFTLPRDKQPKTYTPEEIDKINQTGSSVLFLILFFGCLFMVLQFIASF